MNIRMLHNRWFSGRSAPERAAALLITLALVACGDEGSTPAQAPPNDLGLSQCQLVDGTVLGEPMEPIMVNGVEIQTCRITDTQIPGGAGAAGQGLTLKATHEYEPLAWVIDGSLTIGDNHSYASFDEFTSGDFATLTVPADVTVRAAEGAQIVIHRNGSLTGVGMNITSLDDNLDGSGEWAGIVVNSIGSHPDCPADTSKDKFCNIEGEYGYYGGLSAADAQTEIVGRTFLIGAELGYAFIPGFAGSVSEAGGAVTDGEPLGAAVVLNAPQTDDRGNALRVSVFDVADTGIEINGGYVATLSGSPTGLRLVTRNTGGHAVYWHSGFSGGFQGVFYHNQPDEAALYGVDGDVDLNGITLIDRDFTAGTAISVQGGRVDLRNVLVQNFAACLQLDAAASATLTLVAFGCREATVAAADGTDYAASVTAAALADPNGTYYQADPALLTDLSVGNSELTGLSGGRDVVADSIADYDGHDLRLIYPDCMGVGTLLAAEETVTVGPTSYRLCELSGTIDTNVRLSRQFNDDYFAWVLDGEVSLGADFAELGAAEQLAALESPSYVIVPARTLVYGRAGASLTVHPGVHWIVDGTAANPVEIAALPGEETANWGGVRVLGVDSASCQAGSDSGVCAYADSSRLSIDYLRILQAGDGQAALELREVGPGTTINHLDISQSAGAGLELYGGRVNLNHLLLSDNFGDQLSWQQGYRGTIQYGLFSSGTASAGHVLHGRNDPADHDTSPRSRPTLANLTMVDVGADETGAAILLEQGSGLLLYNSLVSGFARCLDIDDAATAALQTSEPQQIAMLDVVLGCDITLAADDEDAGFDYGYEVAQSASVYEMDPALDDQYLPTNPELPATASSLDLSLAGDSAAYLDGDAAYWGSVENADDGWYLGWSDVGVLLSAECDGKGRLETDYQYTFYYDYSYPLADYGIYQDIFLDYKVCSLPNTLSEDLELTPYTEADAEAAANGTNVVVTEPGSQYGVDGEVTWEHPPIPTIWMLDGLVTVGDGERELSDPAEAEALKADPVELTMQPGVWVMAATEDSGLHVTRGGRLRVLGEPILDDEVCRYQDYGNGRCEFATTGPVSIFGLIGGSGDGALPTIENWGFDYWWGDYSPYAPLSNESPGGYYSFYSRSTLAWRGITVDGFARNNQCENSETAEPNSQVCNISDKLGYHGGYDDSYENLEIQNLYMAGGLLRLNSAAGLIEGLNYQHNQFSDAQAGDVAVVDMDGGMVNIRELLIDFEDIDSSRKPGTLLSWNHGYRGSLQYIYGASWQLADGNESRIEANGHDYFVPLLRGTNGETGHEDDLPRSMPTIANLSLRSYERDTASGQMTTAIDSGLIELVQGSGLYLHNSVMGGTEFDGAVSDYCFKLDESAADRLAAGELVIKQLAATCVVLSDNATLALDGMNGVNQDYATAPGAVFSAYDTEQDYDDEMDVKFDYDRYYPLQIVVDDYGSVPLDLSDSPIADTEFFEVFDFLGTLNYWEKP